MGSLKTLAVVVSICFFTSNLSGSFLPVYYMETGLSIIEITHLLLLTFLAIGLLPTILLKLVKNFERVMSFSILFTMVFYIALIFVKSPILLGLIYGLSIATFWPSFNLLQFRLSESNSRARIVSIFSSVIPSLASVAGPFTGGLIIENFGFTSLFVVSIGFYIVAFFISRKIEFQPEIHKFSVPRNRLFAIFLATFVILGLSESYWLVYPLFVLSLSGKILQMGLVLASSAITISIITFLINWMSDIKRNRVAFALVGVTLSVAWYFGIGFASTVYEVVALSLLSGFAGACSLSWFAHYGDSFGREKYASMLVLMETGLMVGRVVNLAPMLFFMSIFNYKGYFMLLALASLSQIPLFLASRKGSDHGLTQDLSSGS